MTKVAKFWTANKDIEFNVPIPEPAKNIIPKWYKDLPRLAYGQKYQINDDGSDNLGLKACVPFYDAITAGYIIKLHCDVHVSRNEFNEIIIQWKSLGQPIVARPESVAIQLPRINGFTNFKYAWEILYHYILPKGYSALVTQPLNRFDLPFITTSGIVDADHGMGPGAVPFALREDFVGVIKAGTPIMQVIPFKRKRWTTKFISRQDKRAINFTPHNEDGWYKKRLWKRKSYE